MYSYVYVCTEVYMWNTYLHMYHHAHIHVYLYVIYICIYTRVYIMQVHTCTYAIHIYMSNAYIDTHTSSDLQKFFVIFLYFHNQ